MPLLPLPGGDPATDATELYELELPRDSRYRIAIRGALSFAADALSYGSIVPGQENQLNSQVAFGANAVATLRPKQGGDVIGEFKYAAFADIADAPDNWILCDGRIVPKADYPLLGDRCLFVGDLGSSWALPLFQGAVPRMYEDPADVGAQVGANRVTLTLRQIPPHRHTYIRQILGTLLNGENIPTTYATGGTINQTTGTAGLGEAHENRSLSFVVQVFVVGR